MRSEDDRGERPHDDLTARARIRDAALELFGERGYRGTSIRDIARAAGVSPGLVQHHFGSKEGLRQACDDHVLATQRVVIERKLERRDYDADFMGSLYEVSGPGMKYIARGLTEGWPGASVLFDQGVDATARWLTREWPARFPAGAEKTVTSAATMVSMSLGTLVLHEHLGRWFGVDPLERGNQHLTGAAMLEIYACMGEFLSSESGIGLRQAMVELQATLESRKVVDDDSR
jgi:TetR/AcrR family transcriptional regulator, regulator of cefoperazone and chloramphenicol sensitivity